MHQQSHQDNAPAETRGMVAEEVADLDIDLDVALLSDISLPTFLSDLTDDAADGDESMGALTRSLPDRVSRSGGESAVCSGAPVSQAENHDAPSYYETSLYSLLASFPTTQEGPSSSVSSSVASSLRLGRDVSDAGAQIAHLIRIVASVASRAVELDASHQPAPETTEYDARYLLVAVYRMLTTWGSDASPMKLPKATFSKLAGGIHGDRFAGWNRHFQDGRDAGLLSEAMAFWASVGVGDRPTSEAAVAQLRALTNDAAPSPTLQDLANSPIYQRLSLRKLSGFSSAQLSKAQRLRRGVVADNSATQGDALSVTVHTPPSSGSTVGAAVGQGATRSNDARHRNETQEHAARRIARLIRMVGSVATHAVELDESHQPIPGQPAYDSRGLLAAAYKALSSSSHKLRAEGMFSMSNFSRLAGVDRPKRFMAWNDEFKPTLAGPSAFWASQGFDARSDKAATMQALESLQNGPESAPTLEDIAASPLYRKIYINKRYGINAVPIHWSKRARAGGALGESGPLRALPRSVYPVSLDAAGASTQSRQNAAFGARSTNETLPGPSAVMRHRNERATDRVAIGEGTTRSDVPADVALTRDDAAQRIACLIRIAWGVASGELASDTSLPVLAGEARYDPRKVLVAAYTVLSNGAGSTGSKPNLSISRFSALVGAVQGQRLIRWTRQFEASLDDANALWASLGFGAGSDTNATLRALVALRNDGASAPTMRDFEASAFYGKLSAIKQTDVYVAPSGQTKRRRPESGSDAHAYRASRRRAPTSASAARSTSTSTSAQTSHLPRVADGYRLPLPPGTGADVTDPLGLASVLPEPSAPLSDWPYDLAPWSQTPIATEVLDTHDVERPSWSEDALRWLHAGAATPTLPTTTTSQNARFVEPMQLPHDIAGTSVELLPDWSFDNVDWPEMAGSVDALGTEGAPTATPQSRPDVVLDVLTPMVFDDMSLRPASNVSASDYAPSTISSLTRSSMVTLPSVTTTATQGAAAVVAAPPVPLPSVAPGSILFEHGNTRITAGPGADMALIMAMVQAALAASQPAPGANPP